MCRFHIHSVQQLGQRKRRHACNADHWDAHPGEGLSTLDISQFFLSSPQTDKHSAGTPATQYHWDATHVGKALRLHAPVSFLPFTPQTRTCRIRGSTMRLLCSSCSGSTPRPRTTSWAATACSAGTRYHVLCAPLYAYRDFTWAHRDQCSSSGSVQVHAFPPCLADEMDGTQNAVLGKAAANVTEVIQSASVGSKAHTCADTTWSRGMRPRCACRSARRWSQCRAWAC